MSKQIAPAMIDESMRESALSKVTERRPMIYGNLLFRAVAASVSSICLNRKEKDELS